LAASDIRRIVSMVLILAREKVIVPWNLTVDKILGWKY
jgi:hypothetical protein